MSEETNINIPDNIAIAMEIFDQVYNDLGMRYVDGAEVNVNPVMEDDEEVKGLSYNYLTKTHWLQVLYLHGETEAEEAMNPLDEGSWMKFYDQHHDELVPRQLKTFMGYLKDRNWEVINVVWSVPEDLGEDQIAYPTVVLGHEEDQGIYVFTPSIVEGEGSDEDE